MAKKKNIQTFQTTHWTMIVRAGNAMSPEHLQALEELCKSYWHPLYAYVRSCGENPEQSQDLTQSFFAKLLENNLIETADQARGKFRWYLLASFKHFLAHHRQHNSALKRGGGKTFIVFDELEAEKSYKSELVNDLSPDIVYEQRWALTLLARTEKLLSHSYSQTNKSDRFELLKQFLPGKEPSLSYLEVAQQLRTSEGAVKVEIHRLRKKYGQLLHDEVAKTVESPSQIESVICHLIDCLFRK